MSYTANYYWHGDADSRGYVVIPSTPYDNINWNIFVGNGEDNVIFGENGSGVWNEIYSMAGDDIFFGGSGAGNIFVGGSGNDLFVINDYKANITITASADGVTFKHNGVTDIIFSDVEKFATRDNTSYFHIVRSGSDDILSKNTTIIDYLFGDKLFVTLDYVEALGLVEMSVQDFDGDGRLDTCFFGQGNINNYIISDYDIFSHPSFGMIEVVGGGFIFDLG